MFDTLQCEIDEIFLVLNHLASFALTAPFFFANTFRSHFVPNAPTVVQTSHVFPPRVVVQFIFHSRCFCSLRPVVLLHFDACFCVVITACGFGSQTLPVALHMSSAITSDRKRELHLRPNHSGSPCRSLTISNEIIVHFLSDSEKTPHGLCFASFYSVQDGWTPKPIFASKTKDTVDVLHISPTPHPPRHVFASVTLHIPPTNPCLHFAFFLPGNLASFLLD